MLTSAYKHTNERDFTGMIDDLLLLHNLCQIARSKSIELGQRRVVSGDSHALLVIAEELGGDKGDEA